MANNHEQFIAFNDAKRDGLKTNRDALRDKVRKYFKDNWKDEIQPKFHWQGSYAMFTVLNSIKNDTGLGVYELFRLNCGKGEG